MTPLVIAHGVTHRYGDRVALDDVDLTIAPGELCAIIGHNGSGKSTLLRLIAGLQEPSQGSISVAGHAPGSISARALVSYTGDTAVLYDDLSVREHLEFTARMHGVAEWETEAERVGAALGITNRLEDLPRSLSHGLRQRASLANAFVRPFKVLLIDEPFVGLDTASRIQLDRLLHQARAGGSTVLIATHSSSLHQADRVIVLENASKTFDGAPDDAPRQADE